MLILVNQNQRTMKKRMPITTIMTSDVITLNPQTSSLEDAEILFKKHKIRHIPVVSDTQVVGMLSYTDLLRVSFVDAVYEDEEVDTTVYNMFSLHQVMVKNVVSIDASSTIKEVAEILATKEFHALPVTHNGKLVGIVTTTDLINYLLAQF